MPTPTYRAASANLTQPGFVSTFSAALPTGWAAGDLLICVAVWEDSTPVFPATISTPAGWTQTLARTVWGFLSGTPIYGSAIFTRIAQAGDTAPTLTFNQNTTAAAATSAFTGVNPSTPIDTNGATTQQTANSSTPASGAYTTTAANELLLSILMHDKNNGAASDITAGPTGATIEWNVLASGAPVSIALADLAVPTPQTVASSNWTCVHVGSNTSLAVTFALKPAPPKGGSTKSSPAALLATIAHERNLPHKRRKRGH